MSKMSYLEKFERDIFSTHKGDLQIYFLGHGSLFFIWDNKNIYIDPFSRVADFNQMPEADLVMITHEHMDHLDPQALDAILTPQSNIILTEKCHHKLGKGYVMHNGDKLVINEIAILAVPAYNLYHKRENGQPFHPRGEGNGYLMEFEPLRVYIAGDTENIPEMNTLQDIDIAFLPMNLPYTMTPEMTAEAALNFKPKILYPYHYGNTPLEDLTKLLTNHPEIELRFRKMA